MPPRISLQPSLRAITGPSSVQLPFAALSLNPTKTSVRAGSTESRERRRHSPFLMAQSRQRKAANISRQKELTKEREGSVGSPLETEPTPFIQELRKTQSTLQDRDINYFVTPDGLKDAMEYSKNLTSPVRRADRDTADPQLEKEAAERHLQEHRNAQEAIRRIISIANGNTQDRMRLHIQKCIETLGRHNTDKVLPPKPSSVSHESATVHPEKTPRVGPDTGSPEVQVAILTAKIINLSRHLQTTKKDKHNKRNLRVLVHKRQKLLRYLRRKERGGPRWQNLMETLGLSDAAWNGEISM
ncbi:hypothetical protein BO94DRAFT_521286 [Aspergillus sclerotioniger CBS 115572]|uniref:Ribosomal protein S15 n=1 Tax=Aspergillus sclerotioniger CBS 115572 TaxID=1450535 RepID=A0A317W1M0_9EURO|nr:hypothetical protein BO94DRAFT_521286 [Aspergillus sclerotioniger CBS 115572]PWY80373.1 hypothetical protein BO94DRAFT_521286 [Aspergillus sclerotioniger CBS 115572]